MKNMISSGQTMTVTAPSGGTTAGQFLLLGGMACVALASVAEGGAAVVSLTPGIVADQPKATGTGAIAQGDRAYWDASASNFTVTALDNIEVGVFAEAAADGDTTCKIKLGVNSVPGPTS